MIKTQLIRFHYEFGIVCLQDTNSYQVPIAKYQIAFFMFYHSYLNFEFLKNVISTLTHEAISYLGYLNT